MIFMCLNYMDKETHKCFEQVLLYKLDTSTDESEDCMPQMDPIRFQNHYGKECYYSLLMLEFWV